MDVCLRGDGIYGRKSSIPARIRRTGAAGGRDSSEHAAGRGADNGYLCLRPRGAARLGAEVAAELRGGGHFAVFCPRGRRAPVFCRAPALLCGGARSRSAGGVPHAALEHGLAPARAAGRAVGRRHTQLPGHSGLSRRRALARLRLREDGGHPGPGAQGLRRGRMGRVPNGADTPL